mmetsp:Transcript_27797/g.54504  ORF Transcript_27797/g.54504 Transcript_27797/m.54504 type:complete len:103 (-) Transcript_27797:42-350(-)
MLHDVSSKLPCLRLISLPKRLEAPLSRAHKGTCHDGAANAERKRSLTLWLPEARVPKESDMSASVVHIMRPSRLCLPVSVSVSVSNTEQLREPGEGYPTQYR